MKDYQKWFREASFGMFIHWGLYSILGEGEWIRYHKEIPAEEYHKLAWEFNPQHYDPKAWARLARESGMKYMVMTTKHHDGFCLFDSKYTDFTSVKTAAHRDLVAEYVEACRGEGLKVGLYFSCKDWEFPGYFRGPEADPEGFDAMIQHYKNQLLELMTNYGKIDIIWFDCDDDPNFRGYDDPGKLFLADELEPIVRKLQPGILINPRSGMHADFQTPEQNIPTVRNGDDTLYECCMTMGGGWGYSPDSHCVSDGELIGRLISCAANGYNLLLNVSPDPDGVIPADQVRGLGVIRDWLAVNGEAFYNTQRLLPAWWEFTPVGTMATKVDCAYLFVRQIPKDGVGIIRNIANQVLSATILETGEELQVRREGRRVFITGWPEQLPAQRPAVVRLRLDSPARAQFYY